MLKPCLVLSVLLLAGCAAGPTIDVRAAPQRPAADSFRLVGARDAEAAAPAADAEVGRALAAAGWRAAAQAPRWLVETSYTARTERAGAFVGAAPKTPEAWLAAPGRKAWWRRERLVRTLTVRFLDPATGREAARVSAATYRDADLAALAKAAVTSAP